MSSSDVNSSSQLQAMREQGVRPNIPSYDSIPLLSIGKTVRVCKDNRCRRAVIDCVNKESNSVDIVYLKSTCANANVDEAEAEDEEETVPSSQIQPLETFEVVEGCQIAMFDKNLYEGCSVAKEHANQLFKLKDYEAAIEWYSVGIEQLRSFCVPNSGEECWVLANHGGTLVSGIVNSADCNSKTANVSLHRIDSDIQLLEGAPWRTLVPVHKSQLLLHSNLYMNRARCFTQLGLNQAAAQDLSLVIGLWSVRADRLHARQQHVDGSTVDAEVTEFREQLTKAYYLRAKSRLARMRIEPARKDLSEARALQPSQQTQKLLQQLEREIDAAQKEQIRSNKRLVKEISKFAQSALSHLDDTTLGTMEQALLE